MKKIIVILGPTASGKSNLAVKVSKKFGGEVISADSRQVYKGLDIGTGKITKKEMKGVPHHLLNVASPLRRFTALDYKQKAQKKIEEILERGKVPMICGGTGFYISALLGEVQIPEVKPDLTLRRRLEKKNVSELFRILKKLDPRRAKNIDKQNPRRLIRAIEIVSELGRVPELKTQGSKLKILKIGIKISEKELRGRIKKRIDKWFKQGLIKEVINLHKKGLSWKRMAEIGLEYRLAAEYLSRSGLDTPLLKKKMEEKTWQYAKRQMIWFKRDKEIIWMPSNFAMVKNIVEKFLQR